MGQIPMIVAKLGDGVNVIMSLRWPKVYSDDEWFPYDLYGWRRGSVSRTSVFCWLSDLFLIYGWHVTTSWVKCPRWVN